MKIDVKKLEILQARECINSKELREKAKLGYATLVQIKQGKRNLQPITICPAMIETVNIIKNRKANFFILHLIKY